MQKPVKTRYADVLAYTTKDGSEIRELMHPNHHGSRNQSLAEATVAAGRETRLHRHLRSEELYHVISGAGCMILDSERFPVFPGDTILVPPGTAHAVRAEGNAPLRLLCCCSPAYAHEDTEILEDESLA